MTQQAIDEVNKKNDLRLAIALEVCPKKQHTFQSNVVTSLPFSLAPWECFSVTGFKASSFVVLADTDPGAIRQILAVPSPEPVARSGIFGFHAQIDTCGAKLSLI
jgi:hypothetical protein